jgi:hypothetical protein
MVKVLFGLGAIAFLVRGVMGMGDRAVLLGVTVDGYERFVYVALAAAAVLLLWDIRDKVVGD